MRVLSRRNIEAYLLDDAVLTALCIQYGSPETAPQLLAAKAEAIAISVANGGAADGLKRAAGDIYNAAKRLFPGHEFGNDNQAFMRGICAPLLRSTALYTELPRDIFAQ